METLPYLERWIKQIEQRPAVIRGIEVPVNNSDQPIEEVKQVVEKLL